MTGTEDTRWTVIREAAAGSATARAEFARRYGPIARAALAVRWRSSPLLQEIDDAVQEVFVDFLRDHGALERVERGRPGGFRAFLYGVVRNVALRTERTAARQRGRPGAAPFDADRLPADEEALSTAFDRAWAKGLVKEAGDLHRERAAARGEEAMRRVELLRLRFDEGLPVREIAKRWSEESRRVHHEYEKARREFQSALKEVVAAHHPGSSSEIRAECLRLLRCLS